MSSASLDEETTKKVLRQVEFYFSDSNLPRDNFLKKTISESEDGMVSLALICSFSRMKSHLGLGDAKLEDVSDEVVKSVAEVLRKSASLKVSEDGKKIGRATELVKPEEVLEQVDIRTIAAGPLEYNVKLEDVESFFNQYGKVNSVRLPRNVADKRYFCGEALIEFSTEEDAGNVLKQALVYAGAELELKPKKDFDAERAKLLEEYEKSRSSPAANGGNSSDLNSSYPKGLIVAFKLKKISTGESAEENGSHETCKSSKESDSAENFPNGSERVSENVEDTEKELTNKSEEDVSDKVDEQPAEKHEENETGDTVHENEEESPEDSSKKTEDKAVVGGKLNAAMCKDNKDIVMREDLKEVFGKFGTVKFVDYRIGEDSGYIRFEDPEAAQKARAAAVLAEQGGLFVKNFIATLEPVTGDAEKEYWSLLRGNQDRHRDGRGNRGRGGRHNRGGRHFGGKHARSKEHNSTDGRPNKAQKVAAA